MDSELRLLLGTAIDSLVKLELLLYLYPRPGIVQTPDEIGGRLRRPVPEVACALAELSQARLVDRFALGTGKHVMYGPTEDAHVRELLGLLHEQYHSGLAARSRLVHEALHRNSGGRSEPSSDDS